MKIRVINENDWEKAYEFDKTIIRIGSQPSCDIQLKGNGIQPLQLQLVCTTGKNAGYVMRIFADNVTISRGEQVFHGKKMTPYEVLDGDKVSFGTYRLAISLGGEQTRVRKSAHIEAELFLSKRELLPEFPINGILVLRNTGTEKPCQFSMHISGIPNECIQSSPLPYLHPGGSSSVGFVISHLRTKPEPGFHTVSIMLSAADDYMGESLEFNQDIYVAPVFKNEFILEDDAADLSGFKRVSEETESETGPTLYTPTIMPDPSSLIAEEETSEKESSVKRSSEPVVVKSGKSFDGEDTEDTEEAPDGTRRRKKKAPIVIRNDEDAFSDEEPATVVTDAAADEPEPEAEKETAETEPEKSSGSKRRKNTKKEPKPEESLEQAAAWGPVPEGPLAETVPAAEEPAEEKPAEKEVISEPAALQEEKTEEEAAPQEKPAPVMPENEPSVPEAPAPEDTVPDKTETEPPAAETPAAEDVKEISAPETPVPEETREAPVSSEQEIPAEDLSAEGSGEDRRSEEPAREEVPAEPVAETEAVSEVLEPAKETAEEEPGKAESPADMPAAEEELPVPEPVSVSDGIQPELNTAPEEIKETEQVSDSSAPAEKAGLMKIGEIEIENPERVRETEQIAESAPVKTTKRKKAAEKPEKTETKTEEKPEKKTEIPGKGQIPVIHSSHSMAFSDDEEVQAGNEPSTEEQKPVVRFVKGGRFDD